MDMASERRELKSRGKVVMEVLRPKKIGIRCLGPELSLDFNLLSRFARGLAGPTQQTKTTPFRLSPSAFTVV